MSAHKELATLRQNMYVEQAEMNSREIGFYWVKQKGPEGIVPVIALWNGVEWMICQLFEEAILTDDMWQFIDSEMLVPPYEKMNK